jgi:hypothetical protein
MHRITIAIVSFLVAMGCENPEDYTFPLVELDGQSLVVLEIVDSIGVEYGDSNYVFGAVREVDRGVNGEILVLDNIRNRIHVYSSEGHFERQIGRYGSGPGEFSMPMCFEILQDGSICVVDESGWQRFDPQWEFVERIPVGTGTIMQMSSYNENQIVGILSEFEFEDSGFGITKHVCLWNDSTPYEPEQTFLTRVYSGDEPKDLIEIDMLNQIRFTVGDNRIYIAPDPQNLPEVFIFNSCGDSLDTLFLDYPEIPRTEEEIEAEKVYIESLVARSTSGQMQVDMTPYSSYSRIKSLGTDSSGNLWIQRGFEQYPTFDVFEPENHEYLFSAYLPGRDDNSDWIFDISEHGIIAYPQDPEMYCHIYVIERK